jgi:hypothetical protein
MRAEVKHERIPTAGIPGHTADFADIYIAYLDGREVFRSPFRDEAERRLQGHKNVRDRGQIRHNAAAAERIAASEAWKVEKAAVQERRREAL